MTTRHCFHTWNFSVNHRTTSAVFGFSSQACQNFQVDCLAFVYNERKPLSPTPEVLLSFEKPIFKKLKKHKKIAVVFSCIYKMNKGTLQMQHLSKMCKNGVLLESKTAAPFGEGKSMIKILDRLLFRSAGTHGRIHERIKNCYHCSSQNSRNRGSESKALLAIAQSQNLQRRRSHRKKWSFLHKYLNSH